MAVRTEILNAAQADMKLTRIAFEIVEQYIDAKEITLAGIIDRGYDIAKLIKQKIALISPLQVELISIQIDKSNPIECEVLEPFHAANKSIILVDDVADSGRTAMYALKPFLKDLPEKIQLAVLVDRKHKKFPVTADFVGIQLSTNLHDTIRVAIAKDLSLSAYIE
ncbi:MAG: phosphoribosyltransferase [Bacteroidetes bacterium]|jgi:pyrimidine operon attenuation protein/uracil phosphoribosyltransferase|nr:phosphoribosyltransferase [Bacteroidota bacterium]HQW46778.1 phosphoribosyltransferase family protein [Chitinophagaceae bacterium]MBK7039931.1 phosphoribosyltransferase [Bacteroidota bacterium]MBK8329927.1 phosphoribosyltransferase [Bacteroidota bacterium]MBK9301402.1 phosphoribosyltransferase [Bacteroidota bacterium]